MATIRMTDSLKREILSNVNNMFTARIKRAQTEAEATVQPYANELVKLQYPSEVLEGLKGIWAKYTPTTTYLQVSYRTARFRFESRFQLPYQIPQAQSGFELTESRAPELYNKFMAAQAPYIAAIDARQELHDQVKNIISQVVTFKQLVDAWPSALDMVSQDVRRRHHEKTVYTRTKVDVKLDENIKANLLKARISSDV